ncbi:MAG TPA: diaminopimelate epimerase [Planctomycetaceae bacterium]|nr:diaminopimelate epimerase [Planctomycetaceae bacterium]
MRFTKMHGAGNDYVYLDGFAQDVPHDLPELARAMSHRRFGVGSDGLIVIRPSDVADARMQMFNADGSEGEMCGNGIRCVAKYLYDHDICRRDHLRIETGRGVLELELFVEAGRAAKVRVDMGSPILSPESIPTTLPGTPVVDRELLVGDRTFQVTSVSMGNPHCVIFVPQATDELVHTIGPLIESHKAFPQRVNVEFVEVLSPNEVRQRTWERGSGETWACGTGASAVCVAGVLTGRTERRIVNHLLGGDLELEWDDTTDHVMMTGGAVEVFQGEWPDGT